MVKDTMAPTRMKGKSMFWGQARKRETEFDLALLRLLLRCERTGGN